jgi:hypothetical protein
MFATGAFKAGVTDRVYPTRWAMIEDLVAIMRAEIQALIAEGVSYIQLDSLRYVLPLADQHHEYCRQRRTLGAALRVNPRQDFEIVDDWYTVGMRGTGSKSIQLHPDVFIPAHRVISAGSLGGGGFTASLVGAPLGIARGALSV